MHVLCWNVLAQSYIKPDRYPNSSPEALDADRRHALLREQIVAMEPDLLLLQELEPAILSKLQAALGDGYAHSFAQKPGKPEGCAIIWRRALLTVQQEETLVFAAQKRGAAQLAQIARFTHADGPQLTVASAHLQWEPERRAADEHLGRKQLLELLDHVERFEDALQLLGGDFNCISQSPPIESALGRGLRLSCRSQRPWDTININGRRRKIDYLLYTPDTLTPRPGSLPALRRDSPMPSTQMPSDHLPLRVDYSFEG